MAAEFMKWKVDELKAFLKERGIVLNGRKSELAEKVYFASKLKLEVLKKNEEVEIDKNVRRVEKLTIDSGVKLPFPSKLINGWEKGSQNLPDVLEEDVNNYMKASYKALKQGRSLLTSNHIYDVMFHHISTNVKYCFVRCFCVPEEKTNNDSYSLWVCVHKESGEVLTAECTCCAGLSEKCKHVACLLLYIENEVHLGNNKTCTSKPQEWHKPACTSRKRYSATRMSDIAVKKAKKGDGLFLAEKQRITRSSFDPRALHHRTPMKWSQDDWTRLEEATNGNCGILLYKGTDIQNANKYNSPDIRFVTNEITINTTEHIAEPPTLQSIALSVNERVKEQDLNVKSQMFLRELILTPKQSTIIEQKTFGQINNDSWSKHRLGRITSSKIGAVLTKVDNNLNIKNVLSAENLVIDIMQYKPPFKAKATQWGISKEPLARKKYEVSCRKEHRHFEVQETGLVISSKYPYLAASPDGLVSCSCHGKGCLEIKCTWAHREKTVKNAAKCSGTCLHITSDGNVKLKKSHSYYAQVQLHMEATNLKYCDFFYCTSIDYHKERIYYDNEFWEKSTPKLRYYFQKYIVPEMLTSKLKVKYENKLFIKNLLQSLIDKL